MIDSEAGFTFRLAEADDLDALLRLEETCFEHDRLSRRSLRRWIQSKQGILLVALDGPRIVGYGLVWCHKGTRLARLYSLAVHPEMRGRGLARLLLTQLESLTAERKRLYMRLEVAKNNTGAIRLYENCGYRVFGEYSDYYDDHTDALRMQKTIKRIAEGKARLPAPWYQQSTEFTCGPAALMMAMGSLDGSIELTRALELDLWREATTIFMTSGHGGCHPVGLALAAHRRGFEACVYLSTEDPLFVDGVRSDLKKNVLEIVHQRFLEQARQQNISLMIEDVTQEIIEQWLDNGYAVVTLISTFRLDGKKAPHWVTITGIDESCLYVHDPELDDMTTQLAIDRQHVPIAREDFEKMSVFGASRLRTAVAIRRRKLIGRTL